LPVFDGGTLALDEYQQKLKKMLGTRARRKERIHLSFPPKGGGLLRLSRAFSAILTGRFGMGTVRMGAEGRW
jgi:hypothetical protein